MTIQSKISFIAAMRGKVQITRRRFKRGYVVIHPPDQTGKRRTHAKTKKGALALLLALVRTTETLQFSVDPADWQEDVNSDASSVDAASG